jgi:hypothetical protein
VVIVAVREQVDADVLDVRKALTDLEQAVGRLQARHTQTLGVRRLVSDVHRMLDDLDEIGDLPAAPVAAEPHTHYVSDTPYPPDLWADADDEGLDGRSR